MLPVIIPPLIFFFGLLPTHASDQKSFDYPIYRDLSQDCDCLKLKRIQTVDFNMLLEIWSDIQRINCNRSEIYYASNYMANLMSKLDKAKFCDPEFTPSVSTRIHCPLLNQQILKFVDYVMRFQNGLKQMCQCKC
ncbi:hypothetical protein L596_008949 [Steinernema carpocapsae]|uniref:Interleukin n=1 Tax=Steinernema carpocapsae TaxID=34508 RepID=A0A4U5PE69_STECR|nr:hypothetical protein L596_008949 [Steinernema carpocapsae]